MIILIDRSSVDMGVSRMLVFVTGNIFLTIYFLNYNTSMSIRDLDLSHSTSRTYTYLQGKLFICHIQSKYNVFITNIK